MRKSVIRGLIVANLLLASAASARQIENWSYERLFEEADVVIIAGAIKTVPTDATWTETLFDERLFAGVSTQLRVISTVKGAPPKTLNVIHYKLADPKTLINDGPAFVTFLTTPISLDVRHIKPTERNSLVPVQQRLSETSPPEYLLFLNKRSDGDYEAVSGQVDPAFSVRAMFDPTSLQR